MFLLLDVLLDEYTFLMRPAVGQAAALGEMLRDHCGLYNGALQERRDAYRHVSKTTVRYGQQSAQLKDIRAFDPGRQGRWSFSSQQATLRRLEWAFAAFFRRITSGQTPGCPRFRGVTWFDTVDFPKDGDGCRWDATPHDPVTRVRFQGVGHVKVNQHRAVAGNVKTVSVKREGRKWFVVLTADQEQPEPLLATGSVTGIDLGIASFLTTSNGEHVPNPRHARKAAATLEDAQQALSRRSHDPLSVTCDSGRQAAEVCRVRAPREGVMCEVEQPAAVDVHDHAAACPRVSPWAGASCPNRAAK